MFFDFPELLAVSRGGFNNSEGGLLFRSAGYVFTIGSLAGRPRSATQALSVFGHFWLLSLLFSGLQAKGNVSVTFLASSQDLFLSLPLTH